MKIDNHHVHTLARTISTRFQRFLEMTGHPFSVKGNIVKLVALPHVLYQFLPEGIFLIRLNLPERRIAYTKVNFDRLLLLAHNEQKKA